MEIPDQIIDRIRELVRQIEQRIAQIAALINAVLATLPDVLAYIADQVRRGWDIAMARLQEAILWIGDKLSYAGDPWGLNATAGRWRLAGSHVASINESITDLELAVDDRWTGYAAEQYQQSVEPQRSANASIKADFADNIASTMTSLAGAIIAFWVGVVVAIISLLGALAGAAGATGTIVGLPAVPVLIGLGIAAFLAAAGGGLAILVVTADGARVTFAGTAAGISTWPRIATA